MRKLKNEELDRLSIGDFKATEKIPVTLILDNVRSLNNVGSAFRTADAFLIEKIYLCGITGTPPHREITKTALGATDAVDWEYHKDTFELVKALKEEGHTVYSIEQAENSTYLDDFQPHLGDKIACVFGNEVFGVDQKVIDISDGCLEIPQNGTKHSLNISVSIGIVVWDVFNKIKGKQD